MQTVILGTTTVDPCHSARGHASNNLEVVAPQPMPVSQQQAYVGQQPMPMSQQQAYVGQQQMSTSQ